MKSPDELTELFRAQGLKVTPQRQCIFRILHDNQPHPTAEAVYAAVGQEMPTISLRTVYQTLNDLAAMGELVALDLGTGSTRFDPNLDAAPPPRVRPMRAGAPTSTSMSPASQVPAGRTPRLHDRRRPRSSSGAPAPRAPTARPDDPSRSDHPSHHHSTYRSPAHA